MAEQPTKPMTEAGPKTSAERWQAKIESSRRLRDRYLETWKDNVRFRVQKPFTSFPDDTPSHDEVASPEDWARTKQKTSQLNFQLPQIIATAPNPDLTPKTPYVTSYTNQLLRKDTRASYMVDECLSDVINGAGIMVSYLGVDERYEDVEIELAGEPVLDPMTGGPVIDPMTGEVQRGEPRKAMVKRLVSRRFFWKRVSPAQFLWPVEFTESDWEQAPWLGIEEWLTPTEVLRLYGADNEAVQHRVQRAQIDIDDNDATEGTRPKRLSDGVYDPATDMGARTEGIRQTTIFIKASRYRADVSHPDVLQRLVFIDGISDPVVDELFPLQELVPPSAPTPPDPATGSPGSPGAPGYIRGLTGYPIRVASLTYVSDLAVPPSDSEAGRPQVREMLRSRSQMLRQRDASMPLRWYDVNRLDAEVADAIRRGQWQDMIPTMGDGSRVIGEVARATYPRENSQFYMMLTQDLDRSWSLANPNLATPATNKRSATEINTMSNAAQVRLDYEKSKVSRYIAEGAAQLFGIAQLVVDTAEYVKVVGEQGAEVLTAFVPAEVNGPFSFDFVADSSDRIDPIAKRERALKIWNTMGQAPGVNTQALMSEILTLEGMDPAKILTPPAPPPPPAPDIKFSFNGDDVVNPVAMALILKAGLLSPEDIKAAASLIQDSFKQLGTPQPNPAPSNGEGGGDAPPVGAPTEIETPTPPEPILKRSASGQRLV